MHSCPRCHSPLTPAEIATLYASLRHTRRGGRAPSCLCGTCLTCRRRTAKARQRAKGAK
jgi:hypothetical protein